MSGADEELRLQRVYRAYAADPEARARWGVTPGNTLMFNERTRAMASLLASVGDFRVSGWRALEVGCGGGQNLAALADLGVPVDSLYGIDLLPERVLQARSLLPGAHIECGNAVALSFPDRHFQLVLLFTVFSSILDDRTSTQLAAEVDRVLAPLGSILWYDLRVGNPRNPHVRGLSRLDLSKLFPGYIQSSLRSITLLPPLARAIGRVAPRLYPALAAVPILRTHYIGLLRRRGVG